MVHTKELSLLPVSGTSSTPNPKDILSTANSKVGLLRDRPKLLEIGLVFKTEVKQSVIFGGKEHTLTGVADYSLGHKQLRSRSGNLILVAAKKRNCIENAYGKVLAYMGL